MLRVTSLSTTSSTSLSLASPKSRIFTIPSSVTMIFVAMHDPSRVRLTQRIGDLQRVADRLLHAKSVFSDHAVERSSAHVLHHDVVDVSRAADVVDGDDPRMVQRRRRACFLQKAPLALLVAGAR